MKRRFNFCGCGAELVVTLDALQRPRSRCPKCQGVAPAPRKRAFRQVAEEFERVSAFVAESEE